MNNPAQGHARAPVLAAVQAAVLAAIVAGCGGGGGASDAPPTQSSTQSPSSPVQPAGVTLPQYLALREQRATVLGFPSPTADELASIFDHSRAQAVAMMQGLGRGANVIVVPPLRESLVNTVAAAARGDTLAELRARYPAALGPYAAASQIGGISRQVWAQRGARFLPAFLEATDSLGPLPGLGGWAAAEAGSWSDPEVSQGLARLHPELASRAPTSATTRLVVADALADAVGWPATKPFDGVYEGEGGLHQVMPMLRLVSGVKRHTGARFTSEGGLFGQRWLVVLRPRAGSLSEFVSGGALDAAIAEAVHSLSSPTLVALPPGEIVLPVYSAELPSEAASGLGVPKALDEVNADLRGLDGGGTYLQVADATTRLRIGAEGLAMQAAQVASFSFSEKNLYAPSHGNVTTMVTVPDVLAFPLPGCPSAGADLRPFFLVVLDEQRRVMSLAAIATLDGTTCQ